MKKITIILIISICLIIMTGFGISVATQNSVKSDNILNLPFSLNDVISVDVNYFVGVPTNNTVLQITDEKTIETLFQQINGISYEQNQLPIIYGSTVIKFVFRLENEEIHDYVYEQHDNGGVLSSKSDEFEYQISKDMTLILDELNQ